MNNKELSKLLTQLVRILRSKSVVLSFDGESALAVQLLLGKAEQVAKSLDQGTLLITTPTSNIPVTPNESNTPVSG